VTYDLTREIADQTRIRIIRELYAIAQSAHIEEFAKAFDRYDAFRVRELESWQKIANDSIATQIPVFEREL
jgi:hypothetical protein